MWYIYKKDNKVRYSMKQPQEEFFIVDKLPPKILFPYIELKADFDKEEVWWGERELNEEEQREKRINEILKELEELDDKVDRVDEDIIEGMHKEFGYMPYTTTAEVINHKEDLRDELKELKNRGVQDEGDN